MSMDIDLREYTLAHKGEAKMMKSMAPFGRVEIKQALIDLGITCGIDEASPTQLAQARYTVMMSRHNQYVANNTPKVGCA